MCFFKCIQLALGVSSAINSNQIGENQPLMIESLLPIQSPDFPEGEVLIEAIFGDYEVKKAEVTLWQEIDGKQKKQKLKLKEADEELRKWEAMSQPLVEGLEACYTLKTEFKDGPEKKLETEAFCFDVLDDHAATSTELSTMAPPDTMPMSLEISESSTTSTELSTTTTPTTTTTTSTTTTIFAGFELEAEFVSDKYPQELTFQVVREDGYILINKGQSSAKDGKLTAHVMPGEKFCFRATDSFGDGVCCASGRGGYTLRLDHETILEGGEFRYTSGTSCFLVDENGDAQEVEPPSTQLCEAYSPGTSFNMCFDVAIFSETMEANAWMVEGLEEALLSAKQLWSNVVEGTPGAKHDLYLETVAREYDGKGGVLAFAGPRDVTMQNGILRPSSGIIGFDHEDIGGLISSGRLYKTVMHEIGHLLGLGTMWERNGLYDKETGVYSGIHANRNFRQIIRASGGTANWKTTVPIEQDGGPGTHHGHWDETCLEHEMMTGWIDNENVVSKLTIGGLQDLGYTVRYSEAESFTVPDVSKCQTPSRNLRGNENGNKSWHILHGDASRRLSEKDHDAAVNAGKRFLDDNGGEVIDVLFEDSEGSVFSVSVSAEKSE